MTGETHAIRPAAVEVRDVHKWYGAQRVLNGVELTVRPGEVTVILGPSGSGKSTLLGDQPPGEARDRPCQPERRADRRTPTRRAQRDGVPGRRPGEAQGADRAGDPGPARPDRVHLPELQPVPHLTVLDNVAAAPVATRGLKRPEARELARTLLDRVGLADKADAYPRQLLGGQQQQVAIARALALRPRSHPLRPADLRPRPRAGRRGTRRHQGPWPPAAPRSSS